MENSILKFLEEREFLYRMARNLYSLFSKPFHKIRFEFMKWSGRPYFGPYLCARQLWLERYPTMRKLIEQELKMGSSSYKILEIGAWAGQSTILWASVCKENKKGMVFVVDTWGASNNAPKEMLRAIKNNRIFSIFLHNIETSGVRDYIVPIKGSSDVITEILRLEIFDFVYIDGDHAYTQFKKDLLNYMKIVKINGILCGDDLELFSDEIDNLNAKRHCEEDFIFDPKSKKYFHPGITLGIKDVFGNVSMKNGFWAMRRAKDGWETVIL